MSDENKKSGLDRTGEFNRDEVVRLKGHHFKIVLVDGYTGKIGLKWITPEEAALLEAADPAARAGSAGTMGAGSVPSGSASGRGR